MAERAFHLYSKGTGPYELVPAGWLARAALLGPYWALANGLLIRYLALFLPVVPLLALADLVHTAFGYATLAYLAAANFVYFPYKACAWRGQVLQSKGFTLLAVVSGVSAQDAMRKYAESAQSPVDGHPS